MSKYTMKMAATKMVNIYHVSKLETKHIEHMLMYT